MNKKKIRRIIQKKKKTEGATGKKIVSPFF
jgi:hypothetical protein